MHRKARKVLSVAAVAVIMSSSIAFAQPQSKPNGPYIEDEQTISLSGFMSNDELYKTLSQLEKTSKGKMKLEKVGMSNEYPESPGVLVDKGVDSNYPLYVAKFGNESAGKKKVLITTQVHGNEPIGTEAVIDLMKTLCSGNEEAQKILDEVTIWIMPRTNPDGADYEKDGRIYSIRQSLQKWDPSTFGLAQDTKVPYYYSASRVGYDQNRDYSPNLDFTLEAGMEDLLNDASTNNSKTPMQGYLVTPEARIVTNVYEQLKPDVYMDLHHKGFSIDNEGRPVAIEVSADMVDDNKTYTVGGKDYKLDPDVHKLSKQVSIAAAQALEGYSSHIGSVMRYMDNVDSPGSSLGSFGLNNSAIMLMEIKGQTQSLGQKQKGAILKSVRESVYGVLKSLADNSIYDLDTKIYDEMPISYDRVTDPTQSEE